MTPPPPLAEKKPPKPRSEHAFTRKDFKSLGVILAGLVTSAAPTAKFHGDKIDALTQQVATVHAEVHDLCLVVQLDHPGTSICKTTKEEQAQLERSRPSKTELAVLPTVAAPTP